MSRGIDEDKAKELIANLEKLKNSNVIAAPKFTKNALEILETRGVSYVTIKTPLKDYKNYVPGPVAEDFESLIKALKNADIAHTLQHCR